MMRRVVEARPVSIVETGAQCVVNASNESGLLGGGVSRAIAESCGESLLQAEMHAKLETDFGGVLEEGDCMVTSGGISPTIRWLLHVPSVDYRDVAGRHDSSNGRVRECTEAALRAAAQLAIVHGAPRDIAFPLLGAGSGGVSPVQSLRAMIEGLRSFFDGSPDAPIRAIYVAVPEQDRFSLCEKALTSAFG